MAWMKYWLMAVSSAVRTSLRTLMTSASPFMPDLHADRTLGSARPSRGKCSAAGGEVTMQVGQAGAAVLSAARAAQDLRQRAPFDVELARHFLERGARALAPRHGTGDRGRVALARRLDRPGDRVGDGQRLGGHDRRRI